MKKLFIHNPLFRLLSPVFSGIVVYLLILLINDNVEQLREHFLSEELLVCVALSFIIQELARALLLLFKRLPEQVPPIYAYAIQILSSILICIAVVTVTIHIYFTSILGFKPNFEELFVFNSIFCVITLIYILLHISHIYLYKVNSKKLNSELIRKQLIEEDFQNFRRELNPDLLFECFESMIGLVKYDQEKLDDFIDHVAAVYRYLLSKRQEQLVLIEEELQALDNLVKLSNYLPYRVVELNKSVNSSFLTLPGSLISIVELIIRKSIRGLNQKHQIELTENSKELILSYSPFDKIVNPLHESDLDPIQKLFNLYTEAEITYSQADGVRSIKIPKLLVKHD